MHDLDLTRLRADEDAEGFDEDEDEFDDEWGQGEDDELFEMEEGPLEDEDELELAAEFLEIADDQELEEFLGKLFKKAVKGVKRFAHSKVGRALGRGLKSVAKRVLPAAGAALGNLVVPGVGGLVGGKLASMATKLFEFEAEGMSDEEVQLEMARRFVRLSVSAAQRAAAKPGGSPTHSARRALHTAARIHAPGLMRGPLGPRPSSTRGTSSMLATSGRWVRRGNRVILLGV